MFTILDDLYDQVMQFIEHKINNNTYKEKTFATLQTNQLTAILFLT